MLRQRHPERVLRAQAVSPSFRIVPAADLLPDGVAVLADDAEQDGIRIVATVIDRWNDGSERYVDPGESILAAVAGGEVVGIGAISRCPTVDGALRMRRFYVARAWRRRGVARALASALLSSGHDAAAVITCNAGASAAAAPFWESVGFAPVDAAGITHVHRR